MVGCVGGIVVIYCSCPLQVVVVIQQFVVARLVMVLLLVFNGRGSTGFTLFFVAVAVATVIGACWWWSLWLFVAFLLLFTAGTVLLLLPMTQLGLYCSCPNVTATFDFGVCPHTDDGSNKSTSSCNSNIAPAPQLSSTSNQHLCRATISAANNNKTTTVATATTAE